jgi:hypothetical protein
LKWRLLLFRPEVASCVFLDPGRPYQHEPAQGGRGWPEWKGPAPCSAARVPVGTAFDRPPPGQNPACGFPAPGSHIGSPVSVSSIEATEGMGVDDAWGRQRELPGEPHLLFLRPARALTPALEAGMPRVPHVTTEGL